MRGLGFFCIRFSRVGHQDTLLVNTALLPMSRAERLYAKHVYRNVKGATRMVRKRLLGKNWARGYS